MIDAIHLFWIIPFSFFAGFLTASAVIINKLKKIFVNSNQNGSKKTLFRAPFYEGSVKRAFIFM